MDGTSCQHKHLKSKSKYFISQVALKCRQISQDFEDNELELARLGQMIKLHQDALTDTNGDLETARQRRNFLWVPADFLPVMWAENSK